jgi:hypothetical protein
VRGSKKKCKILLWLWVEQGIKVWAVLHRQGIVHSDVCPFDCSTSGTANHLALQYPHARAVLQIFGINIAKAVNTRDLSSYRKDMFRTFHAWNSVVAAALWTIWLSHKKT